MFWDVPVHAYPSLTLQEVICKVLAHKGTDLYVWTWRIDSAAARIVQGWKDMLSLYFILTTTKINGTLKTEHAENNYKKQYNSQDLHENCFLKNSVQTNRNENPPGRNSFGLTDG